MGMVLPMIFIKELLASLNCLTNTSPTHKDQYHRRAKLLAWILAFIILFIIGTFWVIWKFPPDNTAYCQYLDFIGFLAVFFLVAYILNCKGHYPISLFMLISSAFIAPWASLALDPAIMRGDFIPLTYVTFSVLLSSIFLPTYLTFTLAAVQFCGVSLVFFFSPATPSFNWTSFLAYIILMSTLSIVANHIIQRSMKTLKEQANQLAESAVHLEELSTRDDLTKLFNRRYLNETLKRELLQASRTQKTLGLIMLDVDRFKSINDTLGHDAGDAVLVAIGELLSKHIRGSDIACRYGGDEFILVLPNISRELILKRAVELLDSVSSLDVPKAINISAGIAIYPEDGRNGDTLIKSADHALYCAKKIDGNSMVMAKSIRSLTQNGTPKCDKQR